MANLLDENYNNIAPKIICCIYCLCYSISLFFNPTISTWGAVPETYYYYISCSVFSLILLTLIHIHKKDILLSDSDLICIAITLYFVIAGHFNSNSAGFFIKDEILTLLTVVFSTLIFKQYISKQGHFIILLLCLVAFIQICIGLLQAIHAIKHSIPVQHYVRGTFNNSGIYAIFLACLSPCIAYLTGYYKKAKHFELFLKIFSLVPLLFSIMVQSRTAVLLCLIVLTSQILKADFVLSKLKKMSSAPILFILLLVLLAFIGFGLYIKYASVIGRLLIWQTTLQMIIDRPFWGWGLGGFREQYLNYQAAFFSNHENHQAFYIAGQVYYVFNVPLQILVEGGLIGFVLCASLLIRIQQLTITDNCRLVYRNIFYLIILSGLFSYPLNITGMLILVSICLIFIICPSEVKYNVGSVSVGFTILFTMLLIYSFNQYISTRKWKEASTHVLDSKNFSFGLYDDTYPNLKHRGSYLYNYGAELFEAGRYRESISILNECKKIYPSVECYLYLGQAHEQSGEYRLATAYYSRASHIVPSLYTPKYFLLKLYYRLNDEKKVLKVASEILAMKVKVPSEEVLLIKKEAHMIVKRFTKN